MRGLIALGALLFLGGCAEMQTLEELEMLAATTGDWSAVEKRERRMAQRAARCPSEYISVCRSTGGLQRCECASQGDFRSMWREW